MANHHSITIIGYLANDPKNPVSSSPDFVTFTIPVTDKWKDKNGVLQEKTTWYNCNTSKGWLAKIIKSYIKKGTQVFVRGTPNLGVYKGKEGEDKWVINVAIEAFEIISPKEKEVEKEAVEDREISTTNFTIDIDDEIPF